MESKRSACLCPSACLSLSVSFSWSVSLPHTLCLSLALRSLSCCLSMFLPLLSVSFSLFVCLCPCLFGCMSLFLSLSLELWFCRLGGWIEIWSALFVCLSFSACVLVYVCTCLSVSIYLFSVSGASLSDHPLSWSVLFLYKSF